MTDHRERYRLWEEEIMASGRAAQDRVWEAERQRRDEELAAQLALKRAWQAQQPAPMSFWAWVGLISFPAGLVGLLCWLLWGR